METTQQALTAKTTRIAAGEYRVARSDGRAFHIRSVLEGMDKGDWRISEMSDEGYQGEWIADTDTLRSAKDECLTLV
jgi:hypothetical protein